MENKVTSVNFESEQDKHKEIDTQIKMMNALPSWLVALKGLKETSQAKEVELRGGAEINDAARLMKIRDKEL